MTASLPPLWIDGYAFGARVLRGGEEPWKTPDDFGFFLRDLAQLLSLDLVEVPVLPAILAWGEMEGVALGSLGADGMERLMADTRFRAHLKRGLETAAGALGSRALALSLPGPGVLAALCCPEDERDEDALDDLALSLADLLRALYRPELSAFRFAESDPRALDFFDPLTNVARHYEAASVLVLTGEASAAAEEASGFDAVLCEGEGGSGLVLPAAIWNGASAVPASDIPAFTEVPADMVPETVLARLRQLGGQAA
ncbi:hypothetical protein [Parvibaculum sp.]|uniref:hypothetical protein n=1 Tax=Parvibaculum sp. TaxID=2024848 RepID=UPI001B05268B|nr:hypothetical protein [Parvibaculum sp.]MBO6633182.1 hypothetical protein [Parvibaculum sp.]MBO6678850.1 hypothetical protein [Parvibaculum sp.]MBO6683741.1 hypothetical protein [Parvibaculum sp.]MBO6906245.1 hypothetical protein [Parvibaculum sp.]